ncbi:50S ribosomal protein L21e [Candidatus Woesearchaeota archaeon]|nr:50S ribosomal protein L21e [Candidatus Woesearchaeota archaeon]
MTTRKGGFRASTRKKLRKRPRNRGKISVNRLLQKFKKGDKVIITHEAAVHKAMPHPKFKSRTGKITGKQGRIYKVLIKDGKKTKTILAGTAHLIKAK